MYGRNECVQQLVTGLAHKKPPLVSQPEAWLTGQLRPEPARWVKQVRRSLPSLFSRTVAKAITANGIGNILSSKSRALI